MATARFAARRARDLASLALSVYADDIPHEASVEQVANALRVSIGLFVRRLRQAQSEGEPSLPEASALARLDRSGPTTAAALAKREQISPQSMGATLGALEERGLIERRPDPEDGRQAV